MINGFNTFFIKESTFEVQEKSYGTFSLSHSPFEAEQVGWG
jgi:hypothetical protein